MAQYTPNTWTAGDTVTKTKLDRLEAAAAAAQPAADPVSADKVTDGTTNKAYTATEKTKLGGVATGATANSTDATLLARANHTGTQSADTLTDGTTNKAFLSTERTKLTGVATGATANATDALLRDRSTHTGTQAASTVTGLATVATSGAYADLAGKPTTIAPLTPTATKTAAYTAAAGDLAVMNVAGGATTLTLPTAPADKSQVAFLAVGATTTTPLTVNRGGSDTIGPSGATSITAPLANEVTVYQYEAANTRWLPISNVKPLASLDARYAARDIRSRNLPGYWVGAYGGLTVDMAVFGGTFTSASTLIQGHQIAIDCTDLRIVLPYGWKVSSSSTTASETIAPNGTPTKVALVIGSTFYPVTFNGVRSPTCDPAGRLISDPIGGFFAKGTQISARILNGNISGASYANSTPATGPGINPAFTVNRASYNVDAVDSTASGVSGANAADNLWGAAGLIGRPAVAVPFSLGAVGDSLTQGSGDTGGPGYSWITRATNATVPCFRFARSGQWAQAVATVAFYSMPMMAGSTHVAVLLGTNDLIGNRTFAQLSGDLTTVYKAVAAEGAKPIGVTLPPHTTSTDSWATTASQTVAGTSYTGGAGGHRGLTNAWIRAGGGGLLAGYIEFADAVETGRDTGIWQAGTSLDGTHPNSAGHTLAAAAVNLTALAAL